MEVPYFFTDENNDVVKVDTFDNAMNTIKLRYQKLQDRIEHLSQENKELKSGVFATNYVQEALANAEKIINDVKNGEKYDLIEVMACPGGCINGGGQPISDRKIRCQRSKGLYKADEVSKIRNAQDNPLMKELYEKIDGKTHELLHVHYGK